MNTTNLKLLAHEFATIHYDGVVDENRDNWPEELKNASGAIAIKTYCVGINDSKHGYQVIAIEPFKKETSFLIMEISHEGAEINLWTRYGERDWENYGPKENGYWD